MDEHGGRQPVKLQSVGGHDDTVMACWICDQAIRLGGFTFTFGEEETDVAMDVMIAELTGETSTEEDKDPGASGNLIDDNLGGLALPVPLGVM